MKELKSQPVCCDPYAFHNFSSFRFQIRNWTCKIEKFQSDLFDDLDGPNFLREDEGQIYNDDEPDYDEVSTLFWTASYLHFMSWVIPQTKSSVQRKWPWNFTDNYKFNLGNDRFLGFSF